MNLQVIHQMFATPQTDFAVVTYFLEVPFIIIVSENKLGEVTQQGIKY